MSFLRVPIVTLAFAWAIPGSGHFILGQRWRGVAYFVAIAHAFVIGLALTDGLCVSRQEHPIAFIAQAPAGAPLLAAAWFDARRDKADSGTYALLPRPTGDAARDEANRAHKDELVARLDLGLLYTMVAGLLNFLLAIDAFERAIRRGQDEEAAAHREAQGLPPSSAEAST